MAEASFVDRIKHERLGIAFATNKACQTCIFAEGVVDWNGRKLVLDPDKDFCEMYEPDDSNGKPHDVSFEGAPCEWYEAKA